MKTVICIHGGGLIILRGLRNVRNYTSPWWGYQVHLKLVRTLTPKNSRSLFSVRVVPVQWPESDHFCPNFTANIGTDITGFWCRLVWVDTGVFNERQPWRHLAIIRKVRNFIQLYSRQMRYLITQVVPPFAQKADHIKAGVSAAFNCICFSSRQRILPDRLVALLAWYHGRFIIRHSVSHYWCFKCYWVAHLFVENRKS